LERIERRKKRGGRNVRERDPGKIEETYVIHTKKPNPKEGKKGKV